MEVTYRNDLILPLDSVQATLETTGGKGASLARLMAANLPVPDGFHITTVAYQLFVTENDLQYAIQDALQQVDLAQPGTLESVSTTIRNLFADSRTPPDIATAIATAYAKLAGQNPVVAVRSSATAEDLPEASFAGQQETFLNIQGTEQVLEAVKRCWASLWTARAISYRMRKHIDQQQVSLAVVVQLLVPAEASGILFTANPLNGKRDQLVINATWGLGEAVVGGLVTPDQIVMDKESGRVLEKQTADKQIMTIRTNGATEERPVPEELRQAPVLSDEMASELSRLGMQIEKLYGVPMDIEWALADGQFSIVQARPITSLPEVFVPPPHEWELPDPKGSYMRTSIVDFLPEPLSPLFATMGIAVYNQSFQDVLETVSGAKEKFSLANVIFTIQDYAYMRVNFSRREWWELGSQLAPRVINLMRNGPTLFREEALPHYQERVRSLDQKPATGMTATELWQDAHALASAAIDHLIYLQVYTLGSAAGSEGLFTALYNRFYKKEGDPEPAEFMMGYDTQPIQAEKSLFDLAQWALGDPAFTSYLLETDVEKMTADLSDNNTPDGILVEVWAEWKKRVETHLKTYGHMLYDLDFARPVPAEEPAPQFETVKMYLRGEGTSPYERQEKSQRRREQAIQQLRERARGLKGWAVRKAFFGWAQPVGEVREDSIASIGLAYPRLRELLKELGRRLVEAGAISEPTDIFWLEEAEIEARLDALENRTPLESMQEIIEQRKKIHLVERKIAPPTQLPPSKTYMGIPVEAFIPGEGEQEAGRLKGAATSAGKVTGTACVLHGPEDFDKMIQGGILVAKLTTPAWTPLFAMAAGVVTDIGGPLSHGSIVAREYGIPAVLGTIRATQVIKSGQTITVDGTNGIVLLHEVESI